MASKQLTATVRLNTKQAEQKLKNIARAIDSLNRTVGKQNTAYAQVNSALSKTVTLKTRVKQETDKTTNSTKQWANALNSVNGKLNGSKSLIGSIGSGLKTLVNRYLGVMGMGAVINTSDAITSAENKLNYINGGDTALTQEAMDKMYTSAQKVRMGYTDMMSNVSKSMTLAGDSFNNNTDAAIRFQEIMAEAYAVGGASAQEMSSSMYQLIQALGAGTLAGDELRSVREGAPLAYKEIEKFAQGIYNTEESLKDLASQGKISSDMVVAAVMNAGDKMDSAFAQTEQTFGQTWTQIKNTAINSFRPIAEYLRTALNNAVNNGLIQKIGKVFTIVGKVIINVFKIIGNVIDWVADNWNWLKHIVVAGLSIMIAYFLVAKTVAIASAIATAVHWMIVNWQIVLIILSIAALIYAFYMWKTAAIDTCTAICIALLAIAVICFFIFGWVVALVVAAVAVVIWAFEYICWLFGFLAAVIVDILSFIWNIVLWVVQAIASAVLWLIAMIWNLIALVVNIISAALMFIYTLCQWVVAGIVNVAMGLWNVIKGVAQNIGIAFENCWIGAQNAFWGFIEGCLRGLKWLEPAINAVAKVFGKEGFTLSGLIDDVAAKQQDYKEFVNLGDAWNSGFNTMQFDSMGDNLAAGWNTAEFINPNSWASDTWNFMDGAHSGYVNPLDWGGAAYDWGSGVKDSVNQWGSKYQTGFGDMFSLDNTGSSIDNDMNQLDLGGMGNGDFGGDLGNLLGDTGDIADNTGKMADSMDLAEEDLKYLRSVAEMEWKKEYTTNNINVDMSNINNINGESDLDGIVTKLSDKLYEELNIVANGVYA